MIKRVFESLTFIQKVQIYLLVPMLFWLLLFGIENILTKPEQEVKYNTKSFETIPKDKIKKILPSEIVQFIEEKTELYTLSLQTIHIKKRLISVEVGGYLQHIKLFLQKIQLHLDLVSYKLVQEQNSIRLYFIVDSEYFFNQAFLQKEFIAKNQKVKHKVYNIKLDAIVRDEVLLDGSWYKQGENYKDSYQIIAIEERFIKVKHLKTNSFFKMELVDESL